MRQKIRALIENLKQRLRPYSCTPTPKQLFGDQDDTTYEIGVDSTIGEPASGEEECSDYLRTTCAQDKAMCSLAGDCAEVEKRCALCDKPPTPPPFDCTYCSLICKTTPNDSRCSKCKKLCHYDELTDPTPPFNGRVMKDEANNEPVVGVVRDLFRDLLHFSKESLSFVARFTIGMIRFTLILTYCVFALAYNLVTFKWLRNLIDRHRHVPKCPVCPPCPAQKLCPACPICPTKLNLMKKSGINGEAAIGADGDAVFGANGTTVGATENYPLCKDICSAATPVICAACNADAKCIETCKNAPTSVECIQCMAARVCARECTKGQNCTECFACTKHPTSGKQDSCISACNKCGAEKGACEAKCGL